MQIAFVLVFFAGVILLSLCRGFRSRTGRENAFYIFSVGASLTVLLVKSLA